MAAKIRAQELLPDALDMEYLKLYGVVFLGWFLTSVGTAMFFGGFPFLGGSIGGLLGVIFGLLFWVPGAVGLLVGIVATTRKVILESTREELIDVDRITAVESAGESTGAATSDHDRSSAAGSNLRAGSGPGPQSIGTSSSRVSTPSDETDEGSGGSTVGASEGDVGGANETGSNTSDGDGDPLDESEVDASKTDDEER